MTHKELIQKALRWLNITMGCPIVLPEFKTYTGEIPDVIGFYDDGESVVIECKTSRVDFKSDIHKSYRFAYDKDAFGDTEEYDAGLGNYRYYAVIEDIIYPNDLVPPGWGILEFDGENFLETKPSKRFYNARKIDEVKILTTAIRRHGLKISYNDAPNYKPKINFFKPGRLNQRW